MRILFVTRKYPPSTGGMETAAYELYMAFAASNDVRLVKWGGANKMLPVVYPWLFVRALLNGLARRPDVIYMQDGVMAPMGWALKLLLRRPTVLTIHGKEATYANPIYQMLIPPFVRRQSRLVVVSNETKDIVQKALHGANPIVIFNGLNDSFYLRGDRDAHLVTVARALGMDLEALKRHKILHTNGRLVRRKGVLWFIDNVLPELARNQPVLYLVSGKGKDREVIQAAIDEHGLQKQVRLLGRVSDELLHSIYNSADVFVMPNIPVPNDMEGFGLVALEAASCGTTVVASKLEGIQDAIIDGKNGLLVTPLDAEAYVTVLTRELQKPSLNRQVVREYTLQNYAWAKTAEAYEVVMRQVAERR